MDQRRWRNTQARKSDERPRRTVGVVVPGPRDDPPHARRRSPTELRKQTSAGLVIAGQLFASCNSETVPQRVISRAPWIAASQKNARVDSPASGKGQPRIIPRFLPVDDVDIGGRGKIVRQCSRAVSPQVKPAQRRHITPKEKHQPTASSPARNPSRAGLFVFCGCPVRGARYSY
jgi:hypothetical protein